MTAPPNKNTRLLSLSKLLAFSLAFLGLGGCSSLSKKVSLQSPYLTFKIKWSYSSPLSEKSLSFSSLVFIEGSSLLRMDIVQPLIGSIGSFILNNEQVIIQSHLKKQYYKGEFRSQVFFPDFPSFPGSWLMALLRARKQAGWDCQADNQKLASCKTKNFEIQWEYKKSQITGFWIKDLAQRQIQARIKSLSSQPFSPRIFNPVLANRKKQADPLFFQK